MTDVFSTTKRSKVMGSVRSTGTTAEIRCKALLRLLGLKFKSQPRGVLGSPDFVLPEYKLVIFVHGCFWHGHPGCKNADLPASNVTYWTRKIGGNRKRDQRVQRSLRKSGWHCVIIWECKLRNSDSIARRLLKFAKL